MTKPHIRLHYSDIVASWWCSVFYDKKFQYSTKIWLSSVNAIRDVSICEQMVNSRRTRT